MGKKKHRGTSIEKPEDISRFQVDRQLLIIISVGVAVRILYGIHLSESIFLGNYALDSLVLHNWAKDILNGSSASLPFFRAPLYPYFLALTYKVFGISVWPIIIIQNILGILTAAITFRFASKLFDKKVGFCSGLIVALYPTLLFFEGETFITTLAVFLYTLAVFQIYRSVQRPNRVQIILAGLLIGLAGIARPLILPCVIVFPLAYLMTHGKGQLNAAFKNTLILIGATLIPVLPITACNILYGNEFVLLSTQGGVNFYIGNSASADGITVEAPGPNLRLGKYEDNIWTSSVDEAERRTGRELSQSEVSSYWYEQAINDIVAAPAVAIKLYLKKLYLFWHGQEIFNNKSPYYSREYSWLMKSLLWNSVLKFPSGLLFPLMFAGLLLSLRRHSDATVPAAYLIVFSLLVSLFFVCSRFRQPVVPIASMFAAYGIFEMIRMINHKRIRFIGSLFLTLTAMIALNLSKDVESPVNQSQFHFLLGNSFLQAGDYVNGTDHLEEAIALKPENMGVYDVLGKAYLEAGREDRSEGVYQRGFELYPTYPLFGFNLGQLALNKGNDEVAKQYFYQSLDSPEQFPASIDRLGDIFFRQGMLDSSLHYYERLNQLMPENTGLEARIDSLRKQLGDQH